jgi:hypothetical protein
VDSEGIYAIAVVAEGYLNNFDKITAWWTNPGLHLRKGEG